MQPKYLGIALLIAIGALESPIASAQTCAPPPGFVDTPPPDIAPLEQLVSHVEEVIIERPLAAVLDMNSKTPFRINRSGALPGVIGLHRLNQGPFQAGARRLVCHTDGGTASEQVLVWEQTPSETRHRYVVWNFTSPSFAAVSYAVGEFVHSAVGDTQTRVRWTYSFKLKRAGDADSFREAFMDRQWIPYMRDSVAGKKKRAEAVTAYSAE